MFPVRAAASIRRRGISHAQSGGDAFEHDLASRQSPFDSGESLFRACRDTACVHSRNRSRQSPRPPPGSTRCKTSHLPTPDTDSYRAHIYACSSPCSSSLTQSSRSRRTQETYHFSRTGLCLDTRCHEWFQSSARRSYSLTPSARARAKDWAVSRGALGEVSQRRG